MGATMIRMKRSTAISRLGDVVDELERAKQWRGATVNAAYVYGALVNGSDEIDHVEIALVVDQPAARVPWLNRPADLEALAKLLRFDKLPLTWRWRPAEWPVWNHQISHAACVWTVEGGRDLTTPEALSARAADRIRLAQPDDPAALRAQVEVERLAARVHLAEVTAMYHDRAWRRDHSGDGSYPEDTLWAAATAFVELDDWLDRSGP